MCVCVCLLTIMEAEIDHCPFVSGMVLISNNSFPFYNRLPLLDVWSVGMPVSVPLMIGPFTI